MEIVTSLIHDFIKLTYIFDLTVNNLSQQKIRFSMPLHSFKVKFESGLNLFQKVILTNYQTIKSA